ncbi:MAG: hypothetical protein RQ867_06280 [Mariprofundaceae bacterium]|nr:hypothetical protein [Mariprofundaceae bacterium]
MFSQFLTAMVMIGILGAAPVPASAAEPHTPQQGIILSPDVLNLLRAEMREIAGGVQDIALYLAIADWRSIVKTSEKIRASYIMEKKLTTAQATELERALPEQFKLLDAEFHQRAEKLGDAATAHDPELVTFHYSRLIESCTRCHATFAGNRFQGFAPAPLPGHHH